MNKEEAEKYYQHVVFAGNIFIIKEGAWIGEGAVIKEGAWIGEGSVIKEGAWIGEGAVIKEGAWIGVVVDRFVGNIASQNTIRIGCEIHKIDIWLTTGADIAAKYDESAWWEKTGKNMLAYLISQI